MKLSEFRAQFSSEEHFTLHLKHYGMGIYSCIECDEILHYDSSLHTYVGCKHHPYWKETDSGHKYIVGERHDCGVADCPANSKGTS